MMITSRTIGKELEKELKKELGKVLKEQKKKRDGIRKSHKKEKTLEYVETSWTWTSENYNKWFLKTSVEGRTDMPSITAHSHVTVISSSGSNKYLIPRGYKRKDVEGYAVSLKANVVNQIRERLGSTDTNHHEVVSRIFSYTEKAIYLPCDWNDEEAEAKVEENHEPTIDEMWAEYTKRDEKLGPKRHTDLPQLILKTSLGFFLGCVREQREIILEIFMLEEDFEGEAKEKIEKVINPAYEIYNTEDQERLKALRKQVEETLVGDEEVYLLYP